MKKILITIGISLTGLLGWFLYEKPQPPFGAKLTPSPVASGPTYFAEIDSNGVVLRVIVISQEMLNTGLWGDPKNWVETTLDGSKGKNYAGKGYTYDTSKNAFIAPKPKSDAILDETTAKWIIPTPIPTFKESVASISNE